jgi:Domain of unknown function (DUF4347)
MTALPNLTSVAASSPHTPQFVSQSSTRNLLFIDAAVAAGEATSQLSGVEVVQLRPDQDGIKQISRVLADRRNLRSVHLWVQGQLGSLTLGTAKLSLETLDRYADQLQTWSSAFAADGELVISGYKVAKATEGRAFVQQLHQLTGVTVTASIVLTGSAVLGGDWELKMQVGDETAALAGRSPLRAA